MFEIFVNEITQNHSTLEYLARFAKHDEHWKILFIKEYNVGPYTWTYEKHVIQLLKENLSTDGFREL